ncbi:MAG: hypothetical protein IJ666_01400 [Ruminococcus sp.]|nr:hypothetical protein [Ruminococcus sp.]
MYNNVKLEKGLYNLSGKSFTAALEELDPSNAYAGTSLEGLDAFERQLKRYNIKVNGSDSDTVDKFFSSTETAVLFPEYVTRCIRKGFDETVLSSICAVKTVCESGQYLGCDLTDAGSSSSYTSEGEVLTTVSIKESSTAVVLKKFGRLINASYEAVRRQRLDVFGVMLKSIGVNLANAIAKESVSVLTSNVQTINTSALTYDDLADLYGCFESFDMTTVIASPAVASRIVAMQQLMETKADANGKIILPFGSELIKSSAVNDSTVIGIDKNFALEFITSTDLVMETDKLIERQLNKITVSVTCGFKKISSGAIKVLTIGE